MMVKHFAGRFWTDRNNSKYYRGGERVLQHHYFKVIAKDKAQFINGSEIVCARTVWLLLDEATE